MIRVHTHWRDRQDIPNAYRGKPGLFLLPFTTNNEIVELRLLSEAWSHWDHELQLSKEPRPPRLQHRNFNEPLHVPVTVELPVEIWGTIAAFLPKSALRPWLSVPGIWRALAKDHFFQTVTLVFRGLPLAPITLYGEYEHGALPTSDDKHTSGRRRRTVEILCRVARDPTFSKLVRKLVVYVTNIVDLGIFFVFL